MPAIVELRLRADRAGYVPTTIQLHGLACAMFEGEYSANHDGQEKPFSIWPLAPAPDGWLLRGAWVAAGFPQSLLTACGQLRIGPVTCTVTDLALHPASFADLAGGPPCGGARLGFRSPTYFSQNGSRVVTPDPRLIAGSWRRRWNAYTDPGLSIDDDQWRAINQAIRLSEFELHTQRRDTGHNREQPGFVGTATLRVDESASPEARAQFTALARFAGFSGTGAQTTHGFGATCVTVLPARASQHDEEGADATTTTASA
jgi:CRISPR-associated endoribonuclease Cas6